MNVLVRNVAGHDQTDRRDMEASGIPGISMARWNTHAFFTFKLKNTPREFFRNRKRRVDLPRESGLPICLKPGWRELLSHHRDGLWRCDKSSVWKAVLNRIYTEEVISMTMRRIDRGQILSTCGDPFGKRPVLLHG